MAFDTPDDASTRPLRRLNLNLLYALEAIITAPSLTEAGRRVTLSQPAMSAALRKLRDQFGDELVIYNGGERLLTPLAESLQSRVRRSLQDACDVFQTNLAFDPASSTRVFRIAAPEPLELMLLGLVIPEILGEAPRITIDTISFNHQNPSQALDRGADMIIVPGWLVDPAYDARALMGDGISCIVCANHPTISDAMSVEQFLAARHVAVEGAMWPSARLGSELETLLMQRSVAVRTRLHASIPGLLVGTELVATASSWLLQHQAWTSPLRVVPSPIPAESEPIIAQWAAYRANDPAHRWLLGHMVRATRHFRSPTEERASADQGE
jgi:DNA-binding transcriptional LysR family regulator